MTVCGQCGTAIPQGWWHSCTRSPTQLELQLAERVEELERRVAELEAERNVGTFDIEDLYE